MTIGYLFDSMVINLGFSFWAEGGGYCDWIVNSFEIPFQCLPTYNITLDIVPICLDVFALVIHEPYFSCPHLGPIPCSFLAGFL